MLSNELESIRAVLGTVLGKVDPEVADLLRQCRRNLDNAADDARNMEENFYPKEAA